MFQKNSRSTQVQDADFRKKDNQSLTTLHVVKYQPNLGHISWTLLKLRIQRSAFRQNEF